MFNICRQCGQYTEEMTIDTSGPCAVCPTCGYAYPFKRLPLFVVTGASGSGKSTLGLALVPALSDCVVMESDILWRPQFDTPQDGYRDYRNLWLRIAKNIHLAGRPVVLVGSAVPEQFESCPERRYISDILYLALVCDDELLERRLRDRPAWRGSGTPEVLATMRRFNGWLRDHAEATLPPMSLLDTSRRSIAETVELTVAWIRQQWPPEEGES
jgi:AAA domain